MKTKIDISATTLKKAASEAERLGCTVDEYMERAIERQIRQSQSLRGFVAEKSKGASKKKALESLRFIAHAVNLPPVQGDEMPAS